MKVDSELEILPKTLLGKYSSSKRLCSARLAYKLEECIKRVFAPLAQYGCGLMQLCNLLNSSLVMKKPTIQ